jgi:hypothetical protein
MSDDLDVKIVEGDGKGPTVIAEGKGPTLVPTGTPIPPDGGEGGDGKGPTAVPDPDDV